MQTIGQRIRELRKKNDLTQEKLADYLGVSYQAVSKWECGVSSPDLALIRPLTKLLHVTADELLGIGADPDERFAELAERYKATYTSGDLAERYRIATLAVEEYPGDLRCLAWLADATYYRAHDYPGDSERHRAEIERSVRLSERVLEDCDDEKIRRSMINNLVICLGELGRRDEARVWAEQYPENDGYGRDDLLGFCLTGDELALHRQKQIMKALDNLCEKLTCHWSTEAARTKQAVIELFIPDGNSLIYECELMHSAILQAKAFTREGKYDEAVAMLAKAKIHARAYDAIDLPENRGVYKFTAPLFDRIEYDTRLRCVSGTSSCMEDLYGYYLPDAVFDPLREREDFRNLLI